MRSPGRVISQWQGTHTGHCRLRSPWQAPTRHSIVELAAAHMQLPSAKSAGTAKQARRPAHGAEPNWPLPGRAGKGGREGRRAERGVAQLPALLRPPARCRISGLCGLGLTRGTRACSSRTAPRVPPGPPSGAQLSAAGSSLVGASSSGVARVMCRVCRGSTKAHVLQRGRHG